MNNKQIMNSVLSKFMLALLVSFVSMVVGMLFIPPLLSPVCGLVGLIVLIVCSIFKKAKINMAVVYVVVILLGVTIHPTISHHVSTIGATWVLCSFGITTLLFAGLATFAYFSKKDFKFLGTFLFIGLLALILVSLAAIFIGSSILHLILSWVGIVIFSGYVIYDISTIKNGYVKEDDIPNKVLSLYLNFMNLFLGVLRTSGSGK